MLRSCIKQLLNTHMESYKASCACLKLRHEPVFTGQSYVGIRQFDFSCRRPRRPAKYSL